MITIYSVSFVDSLKNDVSNKIIWSDIIILVHESLELKLDNENELISFDPITFVSV